MCITKAFDKLPVPSHARIGPQCRLFVRPTISQRTGTAAHLIFAAADLINLQGASQCTYSAHPHTWAVNISPLSPNDDPALD
jgi:hypothetical protein